MLYSTLRRINQQKDQEMHDQASQRSFSVLHSFFVLKTSKALSFLPRHNKSIKTVSSCEELASSTHFALSVALQEIDISIAAVRPLSSEFKHTLNIIPWRKWTTFLKKTLSIHSMHLRLDLQTLPAISDSIHTEQHQDIWIHSLHDIPLTFDNDITGHDIYDVLLHTHTLCTHTFCMMFKCMSVQDL